MIHEITEVIRMKISSINVKESWKQFAKCCKVYIPLNFF